MSQISGSRSNPVRSGMLRPSALQPSNAPNEPKAGVLRPPVFKLNNVDSEASAPESSEASATAANPFVLATNTTTEEEEEDTLTTATTSSEDTEKKASKNDKPDPMSLVTKNGLQKSNLFATTKTSIPMNENGGFVFGQNIHERVTGDCLQNVELTNKAENDDSNESGNSSKLFAIIGNTNSTEANKPPVEASVENLTEVARVYEESRAQKRKYDEVETFTGEEDETNVLDVNCKLFAFVASNWEERGPGSLRVNDSKDKSKRSRVVFRTSGNLRVLLNTKIWPGMVVERPSLKSLRLTAIDTAGHVKIFLVMARPDDISNLDSALTKRVDFEKNREIPDDDDSDGNVDTGPDNDDDDDVDGAAKGPSPKKPAIFVEGIPSSNS